MKNGKDLNPERDYFGEALFKTIGAVFFWLIKGRSKTLKEEMQRDFRNVFTTMVFYVLVIVLVYYIYKSIT